MKIEAHKGICEIDGISYPMVGFGTYRLKKEVCSSAVKFAADTGYRIFDTATFYHNFQAIAQGLKNKERRDFYLISKVWHDRQSRENLMIDLNQTLEQLETEYLDAYLLHWPNSKISIIETLTTMKQLQKEEKIRHIGLSNVSVNHLKKALAIGVPITWVQVEMHPFFYDHELLDLCKKTGDWSSSVEAFEFR